MSGGNKDIRVDKTADFGVVITALEVVEFRFYVVYIGTIAQRIEGAKGVRDVIVLPNQLAELYALVIRTRRH